MVAEAGGVHQAAAHAHQVAPRQLLVTHRLHPEAAEHYYLLYTEYLIKREFCQILFANERIDTRHSFSIFLPDQ